MSELTSNTGDDLQQSWQPGRGWSARRPRECNDEEREARAIGDRIGHRHHSAAWTPTVGLMRHDLSVPTAIPPPWTMGSPAFETARRAP